MIGTVHLSRIPIALALVVMAAALATQSALALDMRSPDTREAANAPAVVVTDVRSPDTQQAAAQAAVNSIASDQPDAIARALMPEPTSAPTSTTGFDWGDFGIGAAAALGAILMVVLLAALTFAGRGKRRGGTHPAAT